MGLYLEMGPLRGLGKAPRGDPTHLTGVLPGGQATEQSEDTGKRYYICKPGPEATDRTRPPDTLTLAFQVSEL